MQPYLPTGFEPNVFARKSTVDGIGLFAGKRLQKEDIICLYSGNVVSETTESKYVVKVSDQNGSILIDGHDVDNFSGKWINHSLRPNARLVKPIGGILRYKERRVIIVESLKEIQKGEEIFIDYGEEYFMKGGVLDSTYMYGLE